MLSVRAFVLMLVACAIADVGIVVVALTRYPAFFLQPGARLMVAEPLSALALCTGLVSWAGWKPERRWRTLFKIAASCGIIGAALEALNIAVENSSANSPAITLGLMFGLFLSWGFAGSRAKRTTGEFRSGILAAILSAAICMLLAVTFGCVFELLLHPPDSSSVATWTEFQRSGWTDPRAFAIANTLDAGFTHLIEAPFVAILTGIVGSVLVGNSWTSEN